MIKDIQPPYCQTPVIGSPLDELVSEVYNMDCVEGMKHCPDKYFDLAIVDPPYGINIAKRNSSIGQKKGQGKLTSYKTKEWDSNTPNKEYWEQLFRVSKNQIVFGANYFTDFLPPSKGWIVWDKRQPEGVSFAMAELAYTSFDKSVKMFSCSRAFIGNKVANNPAEAQKYIKIHPTQKPILLYDWILAKYAEKSQRILDTHLGSGSSRIASYFYGCHFVGFEIDEDYVKASDKRFKDAISQQRLF